MEEGRLRDLHRTELGSGIRRRRGWHGRKVQDLGKMRTVDLVE